MVIANGNYKNPIKKMLKSQKCTWFLPRISKLDARKQWIIGSIAPKGEVIIDEGAIKAINNGKSLLPAGVKKINGFFVKGDHILVKDENEARPLAHSTLFSSLTKMWSPFSKIPLIFLTPAGNKLFPFPNALTAPLSIIISPFGAIEPIIHCFLASSLEIFGKNHVHF